MDHLRTLLVLLLLVVCCTFASEQFSEELLLRPLPDSKLLAHFEFTFEAPWPNNNSADHYRLLPRSMVRIIKRYQVNEMHLSFTQGRWMYSKWGLPTIPAPPGSELWAYFMPQNNTTPEEQQERVTELWRGASTTLSGLYCASLGQLKTTATCSPSRSFNPQGKVYNNNMMRYGVLPREGVCTENLTPWLKQLPCGDHSGIGALLNPIRLYDVHWHSLGIHTTKLIKYDSDGKLTQKLILKQTLSVILDRTQEWTLNSLFAVQSISACPLAHHSVIKIEKFPNTLKLRPTTDYNEADNLFTYDLKNKSSFSLRAKDVSPAAESRDPKSPLDINRYITGNGLEFGGISTKIHNYQNKTVSITYMDMLPWFIRIYFHTMKIYINDVNVDPYKELTHWVMRPAEVRKSTNLIEFSMNIPASSSVLVTVQFEKAFLHWTEHPPDANRGFDLGSAVVTVHDDVKEYRVYSEALLVSLPTPDFSMPYNVITLTGTVFALFFGAAYNLLIRRPDKSGGNNEYVSNRPIARIIRMILSFIDTPTEKEATEEEKEKNIQSESNDPSESTH